MAFSSMGPRPARQTSVPNQESFQGQWNPTRIFDQWKVAFGTPSSSATQSSPPLRPPTSGTYDTPQSPYSPESNVPMPTSYAPLPAGYVTPTMWQGYGN